MIKISIVTPVLNGEKTLQKTINSVVNQNFTKSEHIIVDGLSKDKTHEIIIKNKEHLSKVFIETDRNLYDAMNKGIQACKGELIGILNADDYYNDETLSLVSKTYDLSSKKNVVIYGDMYNEYNKTRVLSIGDLSNRAFIRGKFRINHPTVFVSRSLYQSIGLFNINYASGADREFLLRAHKNKANFLKIDKPLATFSLGGFTSSYNLNIIFDRTKEEFEILTKYYSKWYALKKSLKQFYRMLRNMIIYNIIGRDKFLRFRIKWINKK